MLVRVVFTWPVRIDDERNKVATIEINRTDSLLFL